MSLYQSAHGNGPEDDQLIAMGREFPVKIYSNLVSLDDGNCEAVCLQLLEIPRRLNCSLG